MVYIFSRFSLFLHISFFSRKSFVWTNLTRPMASKTEQIAFRNQRIIYQLFELLSDKVSWLSVFFFVFVFACLVVFFLTYVVRKLYYTSLCFRNDNHVVHLIIKPPPPSSPLSFPSIVTRPPCTYCHIDFTVQNFKIPKLVVNMN